MNPCPYVFPVQTPKGDRLDLPCEWLEGHTSPHAIHWAEVDGAILPYHWAIHTSAPPNFPSGGASALPSDPGS